MLCCQCMRVCFCQEPWSCICNNYLRNTAMDGICSPMANCNLENKMMLIILNSATWIIFYSVVPTRINTDIDLLFGKKSEPKIVVNFNRASIPK